MTHHSRYLTSSYNLNNLFIALISWTNRNVQIYVLWTNFHTNHIFLLNIFLGTSHMFDTSSMILLLTSKLVSSMYYYFPTILSSSASNIITYMIKENKMIMIFHIFHFRTSFKQNLWKSYSKQNKKITI